MTKNYKLITHSGSFHSDDIFATATLAMLFEKTGDTFELIRTRDPQVIKTGDYVFDVGGIYDKETNRFDHHQIGGAGRRKNDLGSQAGIEYAAFGLVWEKYGADVCGSKKVADLVDRKLVAPIDAADNGFDLVENKFEVSPYYFQHFFSSMNPTWKEESMNQDEVFMRCVEIAKVVLKREIIQAMDALLAEEIVTSVYEKTEDKRIIILDKHYPSDYVLNNFPEPLYVVYPRKGETEGEENWGVKAVRKDPKTFVNRKNLPKLWAGLKDEELQNVTGVRDAIFCHRALFMAVAKSKEGAIKLAQIAVES